MKIATYNVEWFHRLFDPEGGLLEDDRWSARHNVTRAQQLRALGHVFKALDADAVMVIEAPDSHPRRDGIAALEQFAARFGLRTRRAIMGFVNDTKQEIALLYDPDVVSARHDPKASDLAPRFDGSFQALLLPDAPKGAVVWSKPPLELAVTYKGRDLRMIGVHAKSKAAHGAETPDEVLRLSIENRRKQLAQCMWLRARIDDHLAARDPLIVLGDFNDGPGLDRYEALFGQSSVEMVMGVGPGQLVDPNASYALSQRVGATPTSARFYMSHEKRFMQVLLDYIMVSRDLALGAHWRIWHPFDDPKCWEDEPLRDALLAASDHFPVSLEIPL